MLGHARLVERRVQGGYLGPAETVTSMRAIDAAGRRILDRITGL
ncbi:MAG: hypothetical protein AVDCRST_MAG33-554 [uncultured Thermomicrobiales bacterium]|uniref:Uncharacterized protein n=1 Tax=uncultured Thermomicrobiales bacterium TaxID=1645740 RepID=A0A6J4UD88_9BACT|nr:MAG: hypothetical protein AVDCRST_MAG33-554 [uncultured Thermomicrobiales bacterium]